MCMIVAKPIETMPLRKRRTKGRKLRVNLTSRVEFTPIQQTGMVRSIGVTSSEQEASLMAAEGIPIHPLLIRRIRQKAQVCYAASLIATRKPLMDITNLQNEPRSERPEKLTADYKAQLVAKVTSTQEERHKSVVQHCSDFFNCIRYNDIRRLVY